MHVKFIPMEVSLVDSMGNDDSVVNAARVSFKKQASEYTPEQNERLLAFLAREGHWSPFAHTAITVRCKVPLFLAAQLKKHQVGLTWNEVSRRYVTTEIEFYDMQLFHGVPDNKKQGRGESLIRQHEHRMHYNMTCSASLDMYNAAIADGLCPEEARSMLAQATMTEFVWTGSLMAFVRVIQQRSGSGSQLIAQEFAAMLYNVIKDCYPESMKVLLKET